jgi:hypothetical protein
MQFPISTGQAARLIKSIEPRMAEVVRRGKVDPPPPVLAGRRQWGPEHVLQAAWYLDLLTPELEEHLEQDVTHAS